MVLESFKPYKSIEHIVKEYYNISINRNNNLNYQPVLDDCCYDIVFFKEADSYLMCGNKQNFIPIKHKVFTIHNLNSPPYKILIKNTLSFFSIKIQPWMNSYFFSKLKSVGIVNLIEEDKEFECLYQKIFAEEFGENRLELANNFLLTDKMVLSPRIIFVKQICEYIYQEKGIITVNDLCIIFGKSRQYLNRIFKSEVLYSLKKFITTVRILDLIKYRLNDKETALTELCYIYGYFDQSHFIRDFKNVCGVTPSYFFNNPSEFSLRH